jgi:hypothetical protein
MRLVTYLVLKFVHNLLKSVGEIAHWIFFYARPPVNLSLITFPHSDSLINKTFLFFEMLHVISRQRKKLVNFLHTKHCVCAVLLLMFVFCFLQKLKQLIGACIIKYIVNIWYNIKTNKGHKTAADYVIHI